MKIKRFAAVVGAGVLFAGGKALSAPATSITLDGSLGHAATTVTASSPGFYEITPAMGKSAGSNLFESLGTFNLGTGDTADFEADAGTQNIVARVTGGTASNIDGRITSTVFGGSGSSGASLYFINPAGFVFTSNASVNLAGAFTVSTANYVMFADGSVFHADTVDPIADAGLGSAAISAFGFMPASGQVPGAISFSGAQITNAGGINVIGGNLLLDQGAKLLAAGGNLSLFSAASSGELPFSSVAPGSGLARATTTSFGNITVQNGSTLAIDGAGGGNLVIRGGQIVVNHALISSANSGSSAGGTVAIQADTLDVQAGGRISSDTSGMGAGGDVAIQAVTCELDGTADPNANTGIYVQTSDSGNAGRLTLNVSGTLSLLNGGSIDGTTSSSGAGANVSITADSLIMDGTTADAAGSDNLAGIFVSSTGAGNAGSLTIDVTHDISISTFSDIEQILTSTGVGSPVLIKADNLTIDSTADTSALTGIYDQSQGAGSAGSLTLNLKGTLTILAGGLIDGSAEGLGRGAAVSITARKVDLDGTADPGAFTDIVVDSNDQGNAGSLTMKISGGMDILNGAYIEGDANSAGEGPSLDITVGGNLTIDSTNAPDVGTGIHADSFEAGAAGSLTLHVGGALDVLGSGAISGDPSGSGSGADIRITANSLLLNGETINGTDSLTRISADATDTGAGGDIYLDIARSLTVLNGAYITTSTYGSSAAGGNLTISAGSCYMNGGGATTGILANSISGASGPAGSITADFQQDLTILNGARIAATTFGVGKGGSVDVHCGVLSINGAGPDFAGIIAESDGTGTSGDAGKVVVQASQINLYATAQISSSSFGSGLAGGVAIDCSGAIRLDGGSSILAAAADSNAGPVEITAQTLTLTNGSSISTDGVNGGAISILASRNVYLLGSEISAEAQTDGGSIDIGNLQAFVLNGSDISANAGGHGGTVQVVTDDFFGREYDISATGGLVGGDVSLRIANPNLDLASALLPLPNALVTEENRLRESCARSVNHEASSLVVVGRNGTETAPNELRADFGLPMEPLP